MRKPIITDDLLKEYIRYPLPNYYPHEYRLRERVDIRVNEDGTVSSDEKTFEIVVGLGEDITQNNLYPIFLLRIPKIEKITPETDVVDIFINENRNNLKLMYEAFTAIRHNVFDTILYTSEHKFSISNYIGVSDTSGEIELYTIFPFIKPVKKELVIIATPASLHWRCGNCATIKSMVPLRTVIRMKAPKEIFKILSIHRRDRSRDERKALRETVLEILREKRVFKNINEEKFNPVV